MRRLSSVASRPPMVVQVSWRLPLLLSVSSAQLALCKGNANERKESLLSVSRVQLALCKGNTILPYGQNKTAN